MSHAPVVFISSTIEDLKEHREQAAKAALACGLMPLMSENFTASGERLMPEDPARSAFSLPAP